MMHKTKILAGVLGFLAALPALAQESEQPSPVTANITWVSNYLYRGISQTGGKAALQGGFDFSAANGFYLGAWASNVSIWSDIYTQTAGTQGANNSSLEMDTYAGVKNSFATDYTYDVGYLRYSYPGTYKAGATNADTHEIYAALGYKWLAVKYSYSLGDTFGIASARGSNYRDIGINYPVADTGLTLGAHYGKQNYKGAIANSLSLAGQDPSYADYKLSVSERYKGYVFGLAYSKTNAAKGGFYHVLGSDLGQGATVFSVNRTF
jgi:uncharacterized protein (TIGR02001 family)